jgi:hypothetical protein
MREAPLVAARLFEDALDVSHLDVAQRGQRPALLRPADTIRQVLRLDALPRARIAASSIASRSSRKFPGHE